MKNQKDTGSPDSKETDYEEPAAPVSATGIFRQTRIPPPTELNNGNADFREAPSGDVPDSPVSVGGEVFRPPAKVLHPVADEKSSPGEFTQLFQATTPAQPIAPSASTQTAASPQAPLSASGEPKAGEFTRIFMRLPKSREAEPPSELPAVADSQQTSGDSPNREAGEFTRMMRSAERRTESSKADLVTPQSPGIVPPIRSSIPARGFSAPGASGAVAGSAEVTGPLAASVNRPASSPPLAKVSPSNQSNWASGRAGDAFEGDSFPPPESSVGEFTQLFRALDSSGKAPVSTRGIKDPSSAGAPLNGETPHPAAGEFTQLMESLSPEQRGGNRAGISAQPWPHISAPPGPLASPLPEPTPSFDGPPNDTGSFTRIISSSQAREEAGTELKSTADAQPAGAPPAKKGDSALPSLPTPAVPRPLQRMPIPHSPSFGQQPAAGAPTPPVLPSPAPSVGLQGRLQAYLPLLLVVNAFVLAVLIVLVIFALRHH